MILDDYEDKDEDVIVEEEVYCEGVWWSIRESRTTKRIEPQWDNYKSYFK